MNKQLNPSDFPETIRSAAAPENALLPALRIGAFAKSEQAIRELNRAKGDISLNRTRWKIRTGDLDTAILAFKEEKSPDLLIVESGDDPAALLRKLETLSVHCEAGTRVILLGARSTYSADFYRSVVKIGVSDLLVSPLRSRQVIETIKEIYADWSDVRLGKTTAFIGSRGAGSSMIAQNVAATMSRAMSTDVLLVDLDPQFGTVGLNFNAKSTYSLTDILRRGSKLDDILIERISTVMHDRLRLLTVDARMDNRSELPINAIRAILNLPNALRQHVVLDLPPIWSRRMRTIIQRVDTVVITAEPTLRGFRDAGHLVHAVRAARPDKEAPTLVINKLRGGREKHIKTSEFQDFLRLNTVVDVPYNHKLVRKSQAVGRSVFECDEGAQISRSLLKIAKAVNGELNIGDDRSIWDKMASRLWKWW